MNNINSLIESPGNENILNIISLLFLFFTSIIFLVSKEFRADTKIFLTVLIAIIIRNTLIIINVFIIPLPGSGKDAVSFFRLGREQSRLNQIPENFFGSELYEYIVSLMIKYGIDTLLFVISIHNILFFLSLMLILKTLRLLNVTIKFRTLSLIILLLYPSLIFNTITTLREPLQFFFISVSAFTYIFLIKKRFSVIIFLTLNLSIVCLGLLHNGLLALIPIIIGIYSFSLYKQYKSQTIKIFITGLSLTFILGILTAFISGAVTSPLVDSIIGGSGTEYAENYREASPDARASYKSQVSFSNPVTLFISSVSLFIRYFIYPLPWQISSIQDIVPLFENILRLLFLVYIFRYRNYLDSARIFLVIFLVIEFVWSLGTSNWGTASRHHIISSQLLVIAYIYLKYKVDLNTNSIKNIN